MTPQVGDILALILTWTLPDGSLMQNIFKLRILSLIANNWDDIGDNMISWLGVVFADYAQVMNDGIVSDSVELRVRDAVAHEWNTVYTQATNALAGQTTAETSPNPNAATVIAYPALPRYWGAKRFPPPAETALVDGLLTGSALTDLGLSAAQWILGITAGAALNAESGVYSESTETWRPFIGNFTITNVPGTQVTRKQGRGM